MDRGALALLGLGESSGVFSRLEGLGPGTEPGPPGPLDNRWLNPRFPASAGELRPEAARGEGNDSPVVELGDPGPVPGDVIVPGTLDDRCVWW